MHALSFLLQLQEKIRNDELTQSKDRGQFAAQTAMSVVQIALLKEVVDRGPENNDYYIISLVLISVSLGLQVKYPQFYISRKIQISTD